MEKIDFHIHTKPDISKDSKFEFSLDWLVKYVKQSSLDAIAITNHNLFDIDQFDEIANNLKCKVFPGMELSLEDYHVQVIYDNDDTHKIELAEASNRLQELNLGSRRGISIAQFKEFFPDWQNSVLVFEYGKSNNVENISPELLGSSTVCLGVSSPNKFNRVYNQDDMPTPVLFSDAHATCENSNSGRNNIDKLMLKQTYIECDDLDYKSICNVLSDKRLVGLTPDMLKDSFNIRIDDNKRVKVSTGLNLIIGNRGSGKTYFLNNIKDSVDESELFEIAQFQSSQKADDILNAKKSEVEDANFISWKNKYKRQWDCIYNNFIKDDYFLTKDTFVEKLDDYLNQLREYYKCKSKKSIANKIDLFKERDLTPNDSIDMLKEHLDKINDVINFDKLWEYMDIRNNSDIFDLKENIIQFEQNLKTKLKKDKLRERIKEKVNEILESARNVISSQTGVQQIPRIDIFDLYKKYYLTKKANEFLDKKIVKEEVSLDTKNTKDTYDVYKICTRLIKYNNVNEFKKNLSQKSGSFRDPFNKFYNKQQYIQFLNEINKVIKGISRDNLEKCFVNIDSELLTSDNIPTSGGQKVGFSLMVELEESKNKQYVLVDEPEASLDNKFIKEKLISKLKEVAKHSTVFVVTHNSTLGTLLDPNYLIVAKQEGNNYSYLSGEFKQNKISNETKEIPSDEDFINAMEAGFNTYTEKGQIYENLRNH